MLFLVFFFFFSRAFFFLLPLLLFLLCYGTTASLSSLFHRFSSFFSLRFLLVRCLLQIFSLSSFVSSTSSCSVLAFRSREETRPSLSLCLHVISFFVLPSSFPSFYIHCCRFCGRCYSSSRRLSSLCRSSPSPFLVVARPVRPVSSRLPVLAEIRRMTALFTRQYLAIYPAVLPASVLAAVRLCLAVVVYRLSVGCRLCLRPFWSCLFGRLYNHSMFAIPAIVRRFVRRVRRFQSSSRRLSGRRLSDACPSRPLVCPVRPASSAIVWHRHSSDRFYSAVCCPTIFVANFSLPPLIICRHSYCCSAIVPAICLLSSGRASGPSSWSPVCIRLFRPVSGPSDRSPTAQIVARLLFSRCLAVIRPSDLSTVAPTVVRPLRHFGCYPVTPATLARCPAIPASSAHLVVLLVPCSGPFD